MGSQFLLARLGMPRASADFCARATRKMLEYIRKNNDTLRDLTAQDALHTRMCSIATYSLRIFVPPTRWARVKPRSSIGWHHVTRKWILDLDGQLSPSVSV